MSEYVKKYLAQVRRGMLGLNYSIPIGFDRLEEEIGGLEQAMYILLGGYTGSGKTALVDAAYLMNPYDWLQKNEHDLNVEWIYRSQERPGENKVAKLVGIRLFKNHKILISTKEQMNRKNKGSKNSGRVDKELFRLIELESQYVDKMLDNSVTLIEGRMNPTGISIFIKDYMAERGTLVKAGKTIIKIDGKEVMRFSGDNSYVTDTGNIRQFEELEIYGVKKRIEPFSEVFFPKKPNLIVQHITDHIGLLNPEETYTGEKQIIDLHSRNMKHARDLYGISPLDISQFNRDITDPNRLKDKVNLSPRLEDFKSTGNPCENADLVLALFNPYRYKIDSFLGYNISKFITNTGHNRFRSLHALKNSYGADDVGIGLKFLGEIGYMEECKKVMNEMDYRDVLSMGILKAMA